MTWVAPHINGPASMGSRWAVLEGGAGPTYPCTLGWYLSHRECLLSLNFYVFVWFFWGVLGGSFALKHVRSQFPIRDQTHTPCSGSVKY